MGERDLQRLGWDEQEDDERFIKDRSGNGRKKENESKTQQRDEIWRVRRKRLHGEGMERVERRV